MEQRVKDIVDSDRVNALSMRQIKEFFDGAVWKCIEADLKDWFSMLVTLMENAPREDIHGEDKSGNIVLAVRGVNRLQGEMTRVRQMLVLPELYMQDRSIVGEMEEENKHRGERNDN